MQKHFFAPTQLTLDAINPAQGAKFSPNLYAFLRSDSRAVMLRFARVYRSTDDTLWLGYVHDGVFTGARMMSVVCQGARTAVFTQLGLASKLVEVANFWADYQRDGRCAIDPDHVIFFTGDDTRWTGVGEDRKCAWCAAAEARFPKQSNQIAA